MIELGYYTIGRSMKDREVYFRILGENLNKGMNLYVQEYKNTGTLLMIFDVKHIHTKDGPFCMWEKLNNHLLIYQLDECRKVLRSKYKSLRWIIDDNALKDLLLLEAI